MIFWLDWPKGRVYIFCKFKLWKCLLPAYYLFNTLCMQLIYSLPQGKALCINLCHDSNKLREIQLSATAMDSWSDKVMGLTTSGSRGRISSRINFLWWLLLQDLFHPCVTVAACEKSLPFQQKYRCTKTLQLNTRSPSIKQSWSAKREYSSGCLSSLSHCGLIFGIQLQSGIGACEVIWSLFKENN